MKRIAALLAIFTFTFCIFSPLPALPQETPPTWEIYFSPRGGCKDAIIRELNKARHIILVQAYSFTSAPIAKALLSAHKRGVKVEVILDKSQRTEKYSSATFLYNSGIPVKIDAKHMDVHRAHHLSYAIENKIKRDFRGVTDVVVHIEPMEEEGGKNKRRA